MTPDWLVYAGENEGHPLIVMLDRSFGRGYADRSRPWAVMVEIPLARVDGNALPPAEDWPALEAIEAALVGELATDEDDWRYVVRVYGEGVCRFGFYAGRSSAAAARVGRVMKGFEGWSVRTSVQSDPKWSAYESFFPAEEDQGGRKATPADERRPEKAEAELGGIAPSFRDDPDTGPSPAFRERAYRQRQFRPREEQPWRGEETQAHPEE